MTLTSSLCIDLALCDQLALLLDLDGTLIPFAPTVEEANLDRESIVRIEELRRANVTVVIVTGRARASTEPLRALLPRVCWIAEHGNWCCDAGGDWRGPVPIAERDELERVFTALLVEGARVELKSTSVTRGATSVI